LVLPAGVEAKFCLNDKGPKSHLFYEGMKMFSKRRGVLLLFIGFVIFCYEQAGLGAQRSSTWLISSELLEHANLKMLWQRQLPIKEKESLEQLFIVGNQIYALSSRNYMVSLDRESGDVIFSKEIAPAGFAMLGLDLYSNMLISTIGGRLIEIDPASGTQRRARDLAIGITCPAARNSRYYYLAGMDKRLHILHEENLVQVFEVSAENESRITSVVADESSVVFATDGGNIISIMPNMPKRLWQFDARAAIAGDIVKDGGSLFFASKDTNVYRLDIYDLRKPQLAWKFQAESVLDRAPRVTPRVVYQYAFGKSLTAINKRTGESIWSLPGGLDLLAEAAGKAYVITDEKTLVVMDNYTAKKLYWVNCATVTLHAANTVDSKIYIGAEAGRVACLEPVE
jgi:outer membrane protein assembly factor BamB